LFVSQNFAARQATSTSYLDFGAKLKTHGNNKAATATTRVENTMVKTLEARQQVKRVVELEDCADTCATVVVKCVFSCLGKFCVCRIDDVLLMDIRKLISNESRGNDVSFL